MPGGYPSEPNVYENSDLLYTIMYYILDLDLTLSFINARLVEDISCHPCVRFKRWEVSLVKLLCL